MEFLYKLCVHTEYGFVKFEVNTEEEAQLKLDKLTSQKIAIWRADLHILAGRDRNGNSLIGDLVKRMK